MINTKRYSNMSREMEMKTTVETILNNFTSLTLQRLKGKGWRISTVGDVDQGQLSLIAKLNRLIPYGAAIPLLVTCSREMSTYATNRCKNVRSSITGNSSNLEISHMAIISRMVKESAMHHTMEYYAATRRDGLQQQWQWDHTDTMLSQRIRHKCIYWNTKAGKII